MSKNNILLLLAYLSLFQCCSEVYSQQPCDPIKPEISIMGGSLTTGVYDTYQWFKDGSPIVGATQKSYTPKDPGIFTVAVTQKSDNLYVEVTGREETIQTKFRFYPNPAKDKVSIVNPLSSRCRMQVIIRDYVGKEVHRSATWVDPQGTVTIATSSLAPGLYNVSLQTDPHTLSTQKLIIHP